MDNTNRTTTPAPAPAAPGTEPVPPDQALNSYMRGTSCGRVCGTSSPDLVQELLKQGLSDSSASSTAQPSPARTHPEPEATKQLLLVVKNHPVVGLMYPVQASSDIDTDIGKRRCIEQPSPLANQISQAIIAHTSPTERIGFNFVYLLPSSFHRPYPDKLPFDPLLLVQILPGSPLTRDWNRGVTAAQACRRVLESFGLNDVHCLLVEA